MPPEAEVEVEVEEERKRDIVADFLKKNLTKGELALKRAAGLGAQPNVVPVTEPISNGEPRDVEVGWHPVGGLAGKWFAEDTGLGKMITERINHYPDPTQHWAVLVGDYAHQLWMDESFHVIYTNAKINREEWRTFKVGKTTFNDDATRRAGESVIQSIREKHPGYNLITNNCQTYALQLLDAIKVGTNKEFPTTLAVYERLFGHGAVKDLFVDDDGHEQQDEAGDSQGHLPPKRTDTVSLAQQVMNDNTNQLDTQQEYDRHERERDGPFYEQERNSPGYERGRDGPGYERPRDGSRGVSPDYVNEERAPSDRSLGGSGGSGGGSEGEKKKKSRFNLSRFLKR